MAFNAQPKDPPGRKVAIILAAKFKQPLDRQLLHRHERSNPPISKPKRIKHKDP